jgi:hypothetical protein
LLGTRRAQQSRLMRPLPDPRSPNLTVIDEDGTVRIDWPPSKRSQPRKRTAPSCRWRN